MRLAAIDIGTNSIHMIVVNVRPDLSFEVIDREKDMVRLGAGGLDGRNITPTAMAAALQTLAKFKRLAESHKVDEIVAAATSATREAENGGDFIAEVERQTGIRIRVISGAEEARLIHLAAGYGVDIGASTGRRRGHRRRQRRGHARQRHPHDPRPQLQGRRDPADGAVRQVGPSGRARRAADREAPQPEMGSYLDQIAKRGFDRVIGTSGTILSLGALASLGGRQLARRIAQPARLREGDAPAAQAPDQPQPRGAAGDARPRPAARGPVGGRSVLFDTILRRLGADEFTLCDLALREGLVLDYIHRNGARIRKVERYPDVRRRSAIELAERCGYWPDHAQQVAKLALTIFDQTRSVHGLSDRERDWLEYGALLHDIGVHISYERHHRHSYYLIKNGDLRGFDPIEIEIIALIARYHRQATPKKSHEGYRNLGGSKRRAVKAMSAMVRLAEGLDRSHSQALQGLDLYPRGNDYLVRLRTQGTPSWNCGPRTATSDRSSAILGKPIHFEIAETGDKDPAADADQPDDAARVSRKAVRGRRHRRIGKNDAARAARKVA